MSRTVLHVLSQRPSLTGSGVTLDALVRHAAASVTGWNQAAVVGVPATDAQPNVGALPRERIHALRFGTPPSPSPCRG